jgi:hypothetical protein
MDVDEDTKSAILAEVGPAVGSALAVGLVAAAGAALLELIATNYEEDTMIGKKELHPTEQELAVSKSDVTGSEVDGSLSADSATISEGEVGASSLEATAQDAEATASESGATASRAKAGAADIETKALKMY